MNELLNSTVGKEQLQRQTQTTADIFDAVYSAPSTFDLPLDEIKNYVNDLMINQIGTKVFVDNNPEFIITSDLKRVYTNIQSNMKEATFLHSTCAKRGSIIEFPNKSKAIVYDIPNDDIVMFSAKIVIFNSELNFYRPFEEYDEDTKSKTYGDMVKFMLLLDKKIPVFIERIDGQIRNDDVGILHDSVYRVIGSDSMINANVEDVVTINGKYYEISDIDKLTSGICVLQLRTTRDNYDDYIVK